ncbi:single-stranded DNA-binding protein [Holdemania sp. 1001302B_160321_E10]|uniref:single-stranded DNA-binding protein n=1 Tax=Holdemania sp. 1001302B_160321_E10 TaxID=2787120 RepID=UPI00189948A4|nr:single-stranded DNA-binding protein [Holdemania sp. 1001302B_160321_E10]
MINRVVITGRLSKDPELRKTQSGLSVCSFQLAVDRPKQKGQDDAVTDWISCQAWRQAADYICRYAKKGALLAVDGRIQTRSYDNASGQKVNVTEVVCERVEIQRQASTQSSGKQQTSLNQDSYTNDEVFDNVCIDDLPF